MKIKNILFLSLLFSNAIFASTGEIVYHCPTIEDINYKHGTFISTTNYNGVEMKWYTVQNFPEARVNITKFKFTNNANDCIGGTCEIYCVYDTDSRAGILKFSVSRQEYRFSQPIGKNWNEGFCEADKPESCEFMVVPDKW